MKPRILFLVTGDPRTSPRPAEAVRIAAGVAVWQKADITVYLRAEAIRALGEAADALVDGENFARCWPLLTAAGRAIYVQAGAAALRDTTPATMPLTEISDAQLAELVARQTSVLRF